MPCDIRELVVESEEFAEVLDGIKQSRKPGAYGWYPYDTFGALPVLDGMLRDERRDLIGLAGSGRMLDIGCGDGDLSFFLESLGCRVTAIDNPQTNFNRTQGFSTLKAALQSSVDFQACDLDARFDPGKQTYGVAFCFGLLYHLKNPFGFLETLADCARYCVLSTRIAERTMRGVPMSGEPLAYLVGPAETNGDPTNYWIFSEAGLRRIIERTGWELCDYTAVGPQSGSDPARPDRDQRAFCIVRSRRPGPWLEVDLEDGWYEMESGSWRWTGRVFSVRLRGDPSKRELRFRFTLPRPVFDAIGPVRLHAVVNGVRLPEQVFATPGEHVYSAPVGDGGDFAIRFELDKGLLAEGRELGVQVVFWSYDEPEPRALFPISVAAG